MATPNRPLSQNKYTEQNMGNTSFDEDFGVNAVEPLAYDPTSNTLSRMFPANGLNFKPFDYVAYTNTNTTTDTYVFKSGGSGGTTTNTIVIVYTDTTKTQPSTVTKT